jgi:hypothetical protein
MKIRMLLISLLTLAGLTCGIAFHAAIQGVHGGFNGFGGISLSMPGARTRERTTKSNDAVQSNMTALVTKLTDAQKAALTAALAKDAIDSNIQAKLAAVHKIQTDTAMLRSAKILKTIKESHTDDQKKGVANSPVTRQLFGGGGFGGFSGFGSGMPGGGFGGFGGMPGGGFGGFGGMSGGGFGGFGGFGPFGGFGGGMGSGFGFGGFGSFGRGMPLGRC